MQLFKKMSSVSHRLQAVAPHLLTQISMLSQADFNLASVLPEPSLITAPSSRVGSTTDSPAGSPGGGRLMAGAFCDAAAAAAAI